MQTSAQGVTSLELEEGVVLRAYRDAVGVWTIGAGLTKASGVVMPKAGMTITRVQATNLLQAALRDRYEPGVLASMSGARQCEFDAGVSFHYNTGAIAKASWVKAWRKKAARAVIRTGMLAWNKGGGKVLPGLTDRRFREAEMLLDGKYRAAPAKPSPSAETLIYASWGLGLTSVEKNNVRLSLLALGYKAGDKLDAVQRDAAIQFQRDHALTVDGVIGRATLATLQRQLDARSDAKKVATVAAAPVATASVPQGASDLTDQILALPYVESALIAAAAIYVFWFLYARRDTVAVAVNPYLPRLAAFLRSF